MLFQKKFRFLILFVFALVSLAISGAGCGGSGTTADSDDDDAGDATPSDPTVVTLTAGSYTTATLSDAAVGSDGGDITSTDITGFRISVPEGAANEDITFTISSADVSESSGLPDGTTVSSRLYRIETDGSDDWDAFRMFDKPVSVTLPYTTTDDSDDTPRFYVYNADGTLEPVGFDSIDTTNKTVTFNIRTFANAAETASFSTSALTKDGRLVKTRSVTYSIFVAVSTLVNWTAWLTDGATVDSGFRAVSDGWYIPNYGAYYEPSRNGNCMGMVSWAKYWFRKNGSGYYASYHDDDNTTTWVDDETAIELASRAHEAEAAIWDDHVEDEINEQLSAGSVAKSYVGGLFVTNQPVLVYIQQVQLVGGVWTGSGAHAIMIYKADIDDDGNFTFYVYDPNYPNDDTRRITYLDGTGFNTYAGGPDAATPGYQYNYFRHFGYNVAASDATYDALKTAADNDFNNDTVFPTVTLTSITGLTDMDDAMSNTGTTDEGEAKYITTDTSVVVEGTVLGGQAQVDGSVVNNINVFVGDQKYTAAVDNQAGGGTGEFTITLPLKQGENDIVFLASNAGNFSNWAAFERTIIESTASTSALTATLSWSQDDSDVDLYVQEPAFNYLSSSYTGDTVYYAHRRGVDTYNPYLDFDDTTGYGPEHYYAFDGAATLADDSSTENPDSLYGTYTVKVHYYRDWDDDYETDQPISWTVHYRYLAYCVDPCDDPEAEGYWIEDTHYGSLTAANSSNCCDIDNSGSDWSSSFNIEYAEPDPDDYDIPEPTEVMLP